MAQVLYDYKSTYGDTMAVYGNVNRAWEQSRQGEGEGEGPPGDEKSQENEDLSESSSPIENLASDGNSDFESGFLAGDSPVMGGNGMELAGMAVFNGDKMAGTLTTAECQSLAFIKGAFSRTLAVIPDPLEPEKHRVSLEVTKPRRAIYRASLDAHGVTHISIEVPLNARIDFAGNTWADYENDPLMRRHLQEHAEQILGQRAQRLIERLQTELNCDILQLGRRAARNFRTIQEWEAYGWPEQFQNAQIDVNFRVNL